MGIFMNESPIVIGEPHKMHTSVTVDGQGQFTIALIFLGSMTQIGFSPFEKFTLAGLQFEAYFC